MHRNERHLHSIISLARRSNAYEILKPHAFVVLTTSYELLRLSVSYPIAIPSEAAVLS